MEKKDIKNKTIQDFERFENPLENISEAKGNPDKWVAPEMLRRIGESSYNNLDSSLTNE